MVFVSLDHDAGTAAKFFAAMPWLALPFAGPTAAAQRADLRRRFGVAVVSVGGVGGGGGGEGGGEDGGEGQAMLPQFVVIDAKGERVAGDGVRGLRADPLGFPWPQPPRGWSAGGFSAGGGGGGLQWEPLGQKVKGLLGQWQRDLPSRGGERVVYVHCRADLAPSDERLPPASGLLGGDAHWAVDL